MLYLFTTLLAGVGLFLFLSGTLRLSSKRAAHMMAALGNRDTPLSEVILGPPAKRLSHILRMEFYRRRRLKKELDLAGMDITPEYYVAFAIVTGLAAAVPAVALFILAGISKSMIFGLFGTMLLFLSALLFWLEMHRTGKRAKQYRESLETEIPQMTAAVRQGIETTPDIFYILNRYRDVTGKAMRRELDVLLADMTTGDREVALNRFEARLGSEHASALVRALVGIDRGENMQNYLNDLDIQMREWELNQLKKEAAKRPDELRPANLVLLGSMLVLYAILFGTEIWYSVQGFFQVQA